MNYLNLLDPLVRSKSLNNIPSKKLQYILDGIELSNDTIRNKSTKTTAINRYAESNIPIEYWTLKMEKDFKGDSRLLNKYTEYSNNIKNNYINGVSICFAGTHGVGKTFSISCILKKAVEKDYKCLYTTLSDVVSVLTTADNEEKFLAKRELSLVDFLALDEFDNRFFNTDNAADLYARTLESIFRTRSQNKLPTLMATNSPNITESFNGSLKASINSLMSGYIKIFPVTGEDFRKNK